MDRESTPDALPAIMKALSDSSFWGRLFITAVALAAAALGGQIPVPGLNLSILEGPPTDSSYDLMRHISLMPLGLQPVFSIFIAAEVLKLAAPSLLEWLSKSPLNITRFNRRILIAGLVLAAFQAWGMTLGLEQSMSAGGPAVPEPGPHFRLTYIMTVVAGVALLMWLADVITRYGIGSGFWLVLVAGEIGAIKSIAEMLYQMYGIRQISGETLLWIASINVAAVVAVAVLSRLQFANPNVSTEARNLAPADILMPPLLGLAVSGAVTSGWYVLSTIGASETYASQRIQFNSVGHLAAVAALIAFFAWIRAAVYSSSRKERSTAMRWALIIAAATAAYTLALQYLIGLSGVSLIQGGWLTAIILICVCLLPRDLARYFPGDCNPGEDPECVDS